MKFKARYLPMAPKKSTRIPSCPKCFMEVSMLFVVTPTFSARMKSYWLLGVRLPKVFLRISPCDHDLFGTDMDKFSLRVINLNSEESA